MELDGIMLSELNEAKKDKYHTNPLRCQVKRWSFSRTVIRGQRQQWKEKRRKVHKRYEVTEEQEILLLHRDNNNMLYISESDREHFKCLHHEEIINALEHKYV